MALVRVGDDRSVGDVVWLTDDGVFVKRRRTKGRAMMGACGQLGAAEIRRRKYVGLSVGGAEDTQTALD